MEKVIFSLMLIAAVLPEILACQTVAQLRDSVILPCQNSTRDIPTDLLEVQWWTGKHLVTQFQLGVIIQGNRYINRTDLSTENLKKGDFSLSIAHTEYNDSGLYQCVLIQEGQKVTLGEVELVVGEHVSRVTAVSGSQFQLPLPDETPVTVSFLPNGRNYTEFVCEVERHTMTCARRNSSRTLLNNKELIITNITSADSGMFFIRDKETNRTRSVVIVEVLNEGTTVHPGVIVLIVLALLASCCASCLKRCQFEGSRECALCCKALSQLCDCISKYI